MGGVTIAEVSAMINGAIVLGMIDMQCGYIDGADLAVLAQLTLPLAIVLVIVGLLKNRETAATWCALVTRKFFPSYY